MNKPPMEIYHFYSPMNTMCGRERGDDEAIGTHISSQPPLLSEQELSGNLSSLAAGLGDAAPPLTAESVGGSRQTAISNEAAPPPMVAAGEVLADLAGTFDFEAFPPGLAVDQSTTTPFHAAGSVQMGDDFPPPTILLDQAGAPPLDFAGLENDKPPDISTLSRGEAGLLNAQLGEAAPPSESLLIETSSGAAVAGKEGDTVQPHPKTKQPSGKKRQIKRKPKEKS
jgi:hypothetical protein